MKKKRKIALNKLYNLCLFFALCALLICIDSFQEKDIAWTVGSGLVTLAFILVPMTPYAYVFDAEGVSFRYLLWPTERYLWKDIRNITVEWDSSSTHSSGFEFFWASVFCLEANPVGKHRWYMEGHIRKSFRTKRLLEQYWDGTITGYLFEDAKKWLNKKRKQKQKEIKAHLTDEVAPMEREIRAKVREWLAPFIAQAKQYDLDMRADYRYITGDGDERKSRPQEGYTYTLMIEIARPNETDDNRVVLLSVDLLYVRLGKTTYRGVVNEHAEEELRLTLTDVLDEIFKNGIDVYCKDL
ncbi:MAG: hypothetical protein IJO59_00200 [Clostridia bacterium]|nr:hypothetical protein [Clostridia bacterium]